MEISTTRQISNQNIYFVWNTELNFSIAAKFEARFLHCIRFWRKKPFLKKSKFVGKSALKEPFIWPFYTVKMSKVAFSCILKTWFWICCFYLKKIFAKQNTWKESDFELIFVKRVMFWIKIFKRVRLRAIFSQLDKFRIEIVRTCQISKKKLQRMRFWSEIDLHKNRFWWMFCWQKITLGSIYPAKTPTSAVMFFFQKPLNGKKNG